MADGIRESTAGWIWRVLKKTENGIELLQKPEIYLTGPPKTLLKT